jgi:hypothetical protein
MGRPDPGSNPTLEIKDDPDYTECASNVSNAGGCSVVSSVAGGEFVGWKRSASAPLPIARAIRKCLIEPCQLSVGVGDALIKLALHKKFAWLPELADVSHVVVKECQKAGATPAELDRLEKRLDVVKAKPAEDNTDDIIIDNDTVNHNTCRIVNKSFHSVLVALNFREKDTVAMERAMQNQRKKTSSTTIGAGTAGAGSHEIASSMSGDVSMEASGAVKDAAQTSGKVKGQYGFGSGSVSGSRMTSNAASARGLFSAAAQTAASAAAMAAAGGAGYVNQTFSDEDMQSKRELQQFVHGDSLLLGAARLEPGRDIKLGLPKHTIDDSELKVKLKI